MTTELAILAWAVVLGLVHAVSTGQFTIAQHGLPYALSSRDDQKQLTGIGARVQRAFANYMQTFPFFAAAILTAHLAGRHGSLTVTGAYLYLVARLTYVLLYAFDITVARTLAFLASAAGIVMILAALT